MSARNCLLLKRKRQMWNQLKSFFLLKKKVSVWISAWSYILKHFQLLSSGQQSSQKATLAFYATIIATSIFFEENS